MIKQLLNSVIAKYRDLSVSRRSIIDQLATDKLRYFARLRPLIVNYLYYRGSFIFVEREKFEAIEVCFNAPRNSVRDL